jgi:imidazolonepropionase
MMLTEAGCTLALASDCNPGTSYVEAMSFVVALGVIEMGLTVEAALHAATRGGAISLGEEGRGVIAPGFAGDLVVLDAPNPTHLAYRPATPLVWATVKEGEIVHRVDV